MPHGVDTVKKLAPEYEVVGESLSRFSSSVLVAKVDCDAHKSVCKDNDVSGYPTLKWFSSSGEVEKYDGGRNAEEIIGFINDKLSLGAKISKPKTKAIEFDDTNFDSLVLSGEKQAFVKFYAPWCGHCKNLAPDWEKLAKAFENEPDVVVGKLDATKYPDIASRYSVQGYPTLLFFGHGEGPAKFEEDRSLSSLVSYLNKKCGSYRNEDGRLNANAGRIEEFDALTAQLLSGDKPSILQQAYNLLEEHKDKLSSTLYVKLMEKAASNGEVYIKSEIERLNKLINSNSITPAKRDEFAVRVNILSSFVSKE